MVQAAVHVARRMGKDERWETSPWEALLDDLTAHGQASSPGSKLRTME